jgi:flagellar basal-body rod protein FlgF
MENAIYIGLSRQTALRRELSLVANNIANVNTTSFKRELGIYAVAPTTSASGGKLDFVIDHGSSISFEPGSFKVTENDFDIAINGPGFFAVDDGDGVMYTRNGSLSLTPDNQLITRQGDAVLDEDGGPIVIPQDGRKMQISNDGTISLNGEIVAKIKLFEFDNTQALKKKGNSKFETDQDPKTAENSQILQGSLETANVTAVKELVRMVDIQRSYDSIGKFLEKEAERQQTAVRRLGRESQAR